MADHLIEAGVFFQGPFPAAAASFDDSNPAHRDVLRSEAQKLRSESQDVVAESVALRQRTGATIAQARAVSGRLDPARFAVVVSRADA